MITYPFIIFQTAIKELVPMWAAILFSLLIAGAIAGAIVWFVLKRLRSEADLNSTWWQIDYNEILFPTRGRGGVKSSLSQLTTSDDYAMTAKSGKTSSVRAHTQMSIATSLVRERLGFGCLFQNRS